MPQTSVAFSVRRSLNTMVSFIMPSKWEKQTIQKTYALGAKGIITINNSDGDIYVSTWSKPTVDLKVVKKTLKKEQLQLIHIKDIQHKNTLTLTTVCLDQKNKNFHVDFHITIPHNTGITVSTGVGNIKTKKITGRAHLTTQQGNIEIDQTHSTVIGTTTQKGDIRIKEAYNNIKLTTKKGNITVDEARGSVLTATDSGHIKVHSKSVPPISKINLTSTCGNIQLWLPHETNADLHARTTYGTFTCQHHVTIKPFTTQLDKNAWRKFKKEIDGTLGTGEAQITLTSNKSNIKIMKLKKS